MRAALHLVRRAVGGCVGACEGVQGGARVCTGVQGGARVRVRV